MPQVASWRHEPRDTLNSPPIERLSESGGAGGGADEAGSAADAPNSLTRFRGLAPCALPEPPRE